VKKNYIIDLVEDLEDMAGLYICGLDRKTLESKSAADDHCLYLLEVLGKIEPAAPGFKWTKNSWWHLENRGNESDFEITELPQGITEQELVYTLIQMAKEYLAFGSNDFTHSFISAGEGTLKTLEELGYMSTEDKIIYSLTNKPCFTLQDKIHKIEEICRYKAALRTNKFSDLSTKLGEQYYYLQLCCKPEKANYSKFSANLICGRELQNDEFWDAAGLESTESLEDALDNLLKCPELNLLEIKKKFSSDKQINQETNND
jgi:hypothetical protein